MKSLEHIQQKQPIVLLGVTGSIAAYKACELVRLLQKAGVRVKVVMTEHAQELVGAATFRALTGEAVATDLFENPQKPIHHISLSEEADALVIAPCTANVLNKIANGVADDLLTTTALATTAPLILAPAMNVRMLQNTHTQAALKTLESSGALIVGPGEGYLACGDEDSGRMSEPHEICAATLKVFERRRSMEGMRVLITAGPTREFLDPVRFISSPSSGKTGYALAREAAARGAKVVLVSGPTELVRPPRVQHVPVITAEDMLASASDYFDDADIAIFSAAVADFRPKHQADHKLKKGTDLPAAQNGNATHTLELTANPDILATLAARRNADSTHRTGTKDKPFIVGFAAETEDIVKNALSKLTTKGADLIVANDVSNPQIGFASDNNSVYLVYGESCDQTELASKDRLAGIILDRILDTGQL